MQSQSRFDRKNDALSKPLRIAHIFDHSLPLHSGYSFRSRAVLEGQRRLGWDTIHMTTPRQGNALPGTEQIGALDFHRAAPVCGPHWPVLREWREIQSSRKRLIQLVTEEKPDILHAHSPLLTALAALRVARHYDLPLVYEIRAFWEDAAVGNQKDTENSLRYLATKKLETWLCHKVDAVGVICDGLRQDLIHRGIAPGKIFTVPNAVDLGHFGQPLPRDARLALSLGLARDAEVLGFAGSFYDYEGIHYLIDAMSLLRLRHPKLHLLLVGEGPVWAELQQRAAQSPMHKYIHFAGRVAQEDVPRYYSLIDILCFPRRKMRLTELVTPLKPLEAMAQHKLVAASDVGGHRELIRHGETGILFPADDVPAMAFALSKLLTNRKDWPRMIENGKDHIRYVRNWDKSVSAYQPIYGRLLASRGHGRPG